VAQRFGGPAAAAAAGQLHADALGAERQHAASTLASSSGGSPAACACDSDADAAPHGQQHADAEDDDDDEWFDPLVFISRLPPSVPPDATRPGTLLPRRTRTAKQKTLVLDLDETLVHSTLDDATGAETADFDFPVLFNGAEHMVHVRVRPHMQQFLERAAELFEVVVFTASQKVYAERLLNILDPERKLIRHRIYRDSCVFVDGNYLKVSDCADSGLLLGHGAADSVQLAVHGWVKLHPHLNLHLASLSPPHHL